MYLQSCAQYDTLRLLFSGYNLTMLTISSTGIPISHTNPSIPITKKTQKERCQPSLQQARFTQPISIKVAQQRRLAEMTQTMKAVIKKFVAFVPGYLMLQSHAQHCNKSRSPLLRRPIYTPMPSLLHAPCHASSAHCAQSHDADPPSLVQHQSTDLSSVMCCIPVDPRVDQILHIVLSARVVRRIGGSWV